MVVGNTLRYNTEREIYVKFHVKMYEALHRSYEDQQLPAAMYLASAVDNEMEFYFLLI